MSKITEFVTYVISNAATPKFLTATPVAPNSDVVKRMRGTAPVLRLTGVIRKGNTTLKAKTLVITAAKYRDPKTNIRIDTNANTITVTVPEFAKGRGAANRSVNAEDEAVKTLLSAFTK